MKEIGGYFELELSKKEEYHNNAIKLNSGRNSFKYILKSQNIKKVYIPIYICNSIIEPLEELNIDYIFYNIDKNFEIIDDIVLKKNEKLLYVNYFALKSKYINKIIKIYKESLIIDNTQSFFESPRKNIDTFYSPRKFFGVSDGGYLYTQNLLEDNLSQDTSYKFTQHLIGRIDLNANTFYKFYQKSEQRLSNQAIKEMSNFTSRILQSIDYEYIEKKRKENFNYLHSLLNDNNLLDLDQYDINVPFVYPYMSNNTKLRDKLLENKIYTAIYWDEVLKREKATYIEKNFVNKIVPLPIDQRYDLDDMKRIIGIIKE